MNKKILYLTLFICTLCASSHIVAQTAIPTRTFIKGMVQKKDRQTISGRNLHFEKQQLMLIDDKTNQQISVPIDEIKYVKAQTRTYALEGGAIFGSLSLLGALAGYASAETDPYTTVKKPGSTIAIITGVGTGIGLLLGSLRAKEKIVYRELSQPEISIRKEVNPYIQGLEITSLTFAIHF